MSENDSSSITFFIGIIAIIIIVDLIEKFPSRVQETGYWL